MRIDVNKVPAVIKVTILRPFCVSEDFISSLVIVTQIILVTIASRPIISEDMNNPSFHLYFMYIFNFLYTKRYS